jgi:5-methylcytosine-specific restriction endonuclease McrA
MGKASRRHSRTYAHSAKPGICVWCDDPLPRRPDGTINKRLRWHEACVEEYRIANFSSSQRDYVLQAYGGTCRACDQHYAARPLLIREMGNVALLGAGGPHCVIRFETGYEADHIVPLWSVDPRDPASFKFWTKENLQLLCLPCHRDKTKIETAQRAKVKRLQDKRPRRKEVRHGARVLQHLGR